MRLRLLSLLLPCLLLTACAAPEEVETRPKQYQATFLDVLDTGTTVMGYAESQEVFTETAEMAHDLLLEYHQLYDIYNDYEGIHNLKTVNDQAGISPVTVDARILDLLLLCRDLYADSGGKVNAAMAAEILCLKYGVDMIVNTGVAGCLTELPTGSLVVAEDFVQHDVDTSAIGDPVGLVSTVNRVSFPTWKPERCVELLAALGRKAALGRVATGDWFAVRSDRAIFIRDTFHPLLTEMEGGAIAQVCLRNNVPFVAVKSVSDHLFREGQTEEFFDFAHAMENLGAVVLPLVQALQKETL